jgi:hypothetical protein
MSNPQIQQWFRDGKAVEALCGRGEYFLSDVTYREYHSQGLVIGELFIWADSGNFEAAAAAFEDAITSLLADEGFAPALMLLLSYGVHKRETGRELPIDESRILERLVPRVREAGPQLARDETMRNLVLHTSGYFPELRNQLGLGQRYSNLRYPKAGSPADRVLVKTGSTT